MKKYLLLLAAAFVAFAACEKDPKNEEGEPEGPITEVTWQGETYKVITLSNGAIWMAENLRYVPEGKTVSDDPSNNAGIYYPYKVVDGAAVALKDAESIKEYGYLYDTPTAVGAMPNEENFKTFEGAQGICPEGWHVATREDWVNVLGYSLKNKEEEENVTVAEAEYYDDEYGAARGSTIIGSEFNFKVTGYVNRANPSTKGAYAVKPLATAETCTIESVIGKPTMSYYICSTGYQFTEKTGNIQFFGVMVSFVKNNPDGKISCAYNNFLNGGAVRCVKDAE